MTDETAAPEHVDADELARIRQERAANAQRKASLGPGPQMAAVHTVEVPVERASGVEATVRCRFLVPSGPAQGVPGVLVYLHGGAWMFGSIDTFDRLGREIARRTGWAVCMVDYAKSPENLFPAAVEDAWAAVRWALDSSRATLLEMGTPLAEGWRLVVGGDSAGGNLAAVAARKTTESGRRLDGQVLIYPVTDCDVQRPSYRAKPGSSWHMSEVWRTYTGDYPGRGVTTHPDASPLRADSLAGQAPALVLNAEDDSLNSEIDAYAQRLAGAGVPVARHLIPGAPHGILTYWDTVPAASDALDAVAAWLHELP